MMWCKLGLGFKILLSQSESKDWNQGPTLVLVSTRWITSNIPHKTCTMVDNIKQWNFKCMSC
jgi:hypothetical protein